MQKTAENVSHQGEMSENRAEICQIALSDAPWMTEPTRRLPGVQPLEMADWLVVDDAYQVQMAERARLLNSRPQDVLRSASSATEAAEELLELVLAQLAQRDDFDLAAQGVLRPDGITSTIDRAQPLPTLCKLVVEDFCILQKVAEEHVLTGALLCFPASWSLAQKFGHPLTTIHGPVETYTDDIARRVQRLFDAVRPERPLWRANALLYDDPELYQPRTEEVSRKRSNLPRYLRSERQCILRLPKTDAVVFSIQTRQVRLENLSKAQREALIAHPVDEVSEAHP